jgi:hypothetical protein
MFHENVSFKGRCPLITGNIKYRDNYIIMRHVVKIHNFKKWCANVDSNVSSRLLLSRDLQNRRILFVENYFARAGKW